MGQPKTRSLDELRGALEHCYAATEALCADLSDDDWRAQSLCDLADSTPYLDRPSRMLVGPGVAAELALAEVDLTGPIARQIHAARNLRFTM